MLQGYLTKHLWRSSGSAGSGIQMDWTSPTEQPPLGLCGRDPISWATETRSFQRIFVFSIRQQPRLLRCLAAQCWTNFCTCYASSYETSFKSSPQVWISSRSCPAASCAEWWHTGIFLILHTFCILQEFTTDTRSKNKVNQKYLPQEVFWVCRCKHMAEMSK